MPSATTKSPSLKKRKIPSAESGKKLTKRAKSPVGITKEEILELEQAIIESPKNYNKIVTLQGHFQDNLNNDQDIAVTAAVHLCRTFCQLMTTGRLSKHKTDTEDEATVTNWLRDRYKEYISTLCSAVTTSSDKIQEVSLTLLMRLVKEEGKHLIPEGESYYFPHDLFSKIVKAIISSESLDEETKKDFVEKYIDTYDDVRYSFFSSMKRILDDETLSVATLNNSVTLLLLLKNLPVASTPEFDSFLALQLPRGNAKKAKSPTLLSLSTHRKLLQETWLLILRRPLPEELCKSVLLSAERRIVPSFTKPQLLMDFLIACYDHGGTTSLLALNGLFHLISTKNLDYPNFFTKLYALVDRNLFHVKYRSRFFRLLETFLGSTHLPATLVASFIKRLSRLCLTAPPGAIVVVVPFIYNLFKKHKAATYMMHRIPIDADELQDWMQNGYQDPFDPEEEDPLQTGAIESCVWEIETLMGHWHPNVATLARVIKEQFTKDRYLLEDFLDHSYGSMLESEINRDLKKDPVVETDIPKRVMTRNEQYPNHMSLDLLAGLVDVQGEN
ncbi:CBF/Mak21 family-domain-containing protein [Pyronema domesticum]|nr:CBF/Mak21 family-domain-containing protein [Pyronema domesticum]